jgi:PEGA domain
MREALHSPVTVEGRLAMKHIAPFFVLLAVCFAAAPLTAAPTVPPRFNTVVVYHFTSSSGMSQSQDFIHYFSDDLSEGLERSNVATQVVDQGTAVPDSVAANSLVIEGRFLSHEDAALLKPGKLIVEISIYRLSDHALVKTWAATTHFPLNGDHKDRAYAYYTGFAAADTIVDALKTVNLSSVTPATPGTGPTAPTSAPNAAPSPAPNAAPGAPESAPSPTSTPAPPPNAAPTGSSTVVPSGSDEVASVQLSSDPTGAEITIDGSYVGNTPSLIKLKPGTHLIRMTLPGYAPWERSIETAAGESRNFAATLEKASQ